MVEKLLGSPSLQKASWYGTVAPTVLFFEQTQLLLPPEQSSFTPVLEPVHCAVSTHVGDVPVRAPDAHTSVMFPFEQPTSSAHTVAMATMATMERMRLTRPTATRRLASSCVAADSLGFCAMPCFAICFFDARPPVPQSRADWRVDGRPCSHRLAVAVGS